MIEDEDHDELVTALHDVMLPTSTPVLREIEVAARFCVSDDSEDGTGTWFDAVALDGGVLAMVVGEVVGTGLSAAATMGQVRAVLRTGLFRWGEIGPALALADVHARHDAEARGTTVTVALLDPAAHTLTWATAGHQPPLVAGATGALRLLEATGTGPLGGGCGSRETSTRSVTDDETILLTSVAVGATPAGGSAPPAALGGPDALADTLLHWGSDLGAADALTVVAARLRSEPIADLAVEVGSGPTGPHTARVSLTAWLEAVPTPPADAMALVHAVSEAVANAVEHAYVGATLGAVRVEACLDAAGEISVEVRDRGRWRPATDDPGRGLGLAMAAGLVDHLGVQTGDDGTVVRIRHRLSRPVHLDRTPKRYAFGSPVVELTHRGAGTVELRGPFGHDDVDRVGAELLLASRGRTRELHVHLAEVTHLSTSAVRLLSDLVGKGADPTPRSSRVLLHAPGGSPAQRQLDRARVPHDAG